MSLRHFLLLSLVCAGVPACAPKQTTASESGETQATVDADAAALATAKAAVAGMMGVSAVAVLDGTSPSLAMATKVENVRVLTINKEIVLLVPFTGVNKSGAAILSPINIQDGKIIQNSINLESGSFASIRKDRPYCSLVLSGLALGKDLRISAGTSLPIVTSPAQGIAAARSNELLLEGKGQLNSLVCSNLADNTITATALQEIAGNILMVSERARE